mmetsp:Transcript_44360/g.105027  ORF Transcript_44360/g.105027 Transcript_44360/m.105027 type:complete len:599 (+) Transcript_44360:143-1939(+)
MATAESVSNTSEFDMLLEQLRACHVRQVLHAQQPTGMHARSDNAAFSELKKAVSFNHPQPCVPSANTVGSAGESPGKAVCGTLAAPDWGSYLSRSSCGSGSDAEDPESPDKESSQKEETETAFEGRAGTDGSRSFGLQAVQYLQQHTQKRQDTMLFASALDELSHRKDSRRCTIWHGYKPLRKAVSSAYFEFAFGFLIILNTVIFAVEAQINGWDKGVQRSFLHSTSPVLGNKDPWEGILEAARVLEIGIGFAFVIEVIIKILGLGLISFVRDVWNWLDTTIVLAWVFEICATAARFDGAAVWRSLRVLRCFRVMRLLKTVGLFDSLYLLHAALRGSIGVLTWSLLYLAVVQITLALVVSQYLHEFYLGREDVPHSNREEVFQYFGTFSYATLTMFEMTLANWPPVCRVMMHYVSEWWVLFALVHKLTIGFAIIGIINGVVMQETFKAAAQDKDVMVRDKRKAIDKVRHRLQTVFRCADEHEDGKLTLEEFSKVCANPVLKLWLSSIGLNTSDATKVFNLIDNGDGYLTADELVHGVERFRGFASSIDLHVTIKELLNKFHHMSHVQGRALNSFQQQLSEQSACLKDFTGEVSYKHAT